MVLLERNSSITRDTQCDDAQRFKLVFLMGIVQSMRSIVSGLVLVLILTTVVTVGVKYCSLEDSVELRSIGLRLKHKLFCKKRLKEAPHHDYVKRNRFSSLRVSSSGTTGPSLVSNKGIEHYFVSLYAGYAFASSVQNFVQSLYLSERLLL